MGKSSRQIQEPFLMMPMQVLNSQTYLALSSSAVKLLLDIGSQYRGNNNGDLVAAFTVLQDRGWKSEATLDRAKKKLIASGFIVETRKGGRNNTCSLYALVWRPLDYDPKMDIDPAAFPLGKWADPPLKKPKSSKSSTTKTVVGRDQIATVLKVREAA